MFLKFKMITIYNSATHACPASAPSSVIGEGAWMAVARQLQGKGRHCRGRNAAGPETGMRVGIENWKLKIEKALCAFFDVLPVPRTFFNFQFSIFNSCREVICRA